MAVLGAGAVLYGTWQLLSDLPAMLSGAITLFAETLAALAFVGAVVSRLPQPWSGLLGGLVSIIGAVVNLASAADKLWWADAAISLAVDGSQAAVEGPLAFVIDAITAAGGYALVALGYGMLAQASIDDALSGQLSAASVSDICNFPLVCAGLPSQPASGYWGK